MAYVCAKCGKKAKTLESNVRCSYCGGRIMVKSRPNLSNEVSTD